VARIRNTKGGAVLLLTAQTKTGKTICLGMDYKKETLLLLRNKEEFICPVCGEGVLLKLGDQRIYHFAHRNGVNCKNFYENESVYHMDGKRQLYQWIIGQGIQAALEYYDPEIQQRPDIMFRHNGVKYALEYQCSPIPEEIFIKRTERYYKNGYTPLWIMAYRNIKSKRKNIFALSNFDYFFLRKTINKEFIILSYCPEKMQFHIVSSILPYSIKNAIAQRFTYPINKIGLDVILMPKLMNTINPTQWKTELENSNLKWSFHPNPIQNHFLHEIYNQNLNLFLLPPEIGLPVRHSFLILTSPTIWQTYVYLDNIKPKYPGDYIYMKDLERSFNKRIRKKEITIRKLPYIEKVNPFIAVIEYFILLASLGILTRKNDNIFQLQKRIIIPSTNRESTEKKYEFYQKNKHILSKI
jgi:competence protein CoiA